MGRDGQQKNKKFDNRREREREREREAKDHKLDEIRCKQKEKVTKCQWNGL